MESLSARGSGSSIRSRESRSLQAGGDPLAFLSPEVREFALLAADSSAPVLLYGETGSGKTHVARLIHQLGRQSRRPFVHVNCASIPESLFEREMFGHIRGAFTGATDSKAGLFESASGGTLFLDEIGELPSVLQPKLLQALECGRIRRVGSTQDTPVDVRVIAATNRDLWNLVQQGQFREDLYFRCGVLDCRIPSLRERLRGVADLVHHLLANAAPSVPRPSGIEPEVLQILCTYAWPGNIRELDNVLRRAAIYAQGGVIQHQHLPTRLLAVELRSEHAPQSTVGRDSHRYAAPDDPELERVALIEALRIEKGNRTRAAKRLGMSRQTMWIKVGRYDVAPHEWERAPDNRDGESH